MKLFLIRNFFHPFGDFSLSLFPLNILRPSELRETIAPGHAYERQPNWLLFPSLLYLNYFSTWVIFRVLPNILPNYYVFSDTEL